MNKGIWIIWLLMIGVCMVQPACVPVEEKAKKTFDINANTEALHEVADLEIKQDKDSLVLLLKSDDPTLRYAAAKAFASYRDSTALVALFPLLGDPQQQIRSIAAFAIGQIGSNSAEGQMTAAFDGRDSARLYHPPRCQPPVKV